MRERNGKIYYGKIENVSYLFLRVYDNRIIWFTIPA
jgi:hypothetical protein